MSDSESVARALQEAKALNPESPWLWRPDWADSRVGAKASGSSHWWWWAIAWNGFTTLLCVIVFSQDGDFVRDKSLVTAFTLIPMALIGLYFLQMAIRTTIQRRRFGAAVLRLDTLPGTVGGQLRGSVEIEGLERVPASGFDIQLRCERHVMHEGKIHEEGSRGVQRGHRSWVVWQDDYNVASPAGGGVPIQFDIPLGSQETSRDAPFPYIESEFQPAEWLE